MPDNKGVPQTPGVQPEEPFMAAQGGPHEMPKPGNLACPKCGFLLHVSGQDCPNCRALKASEDAEIAAAQAVLDRRKK